MSAPGRNKVLLILIWISAAVAAGTLVPFDAAKANDLGYFSACPFAPWSTLTMLLLAGLAWVMRQYFLTRPPPPPPIS